VLVTRRNVPDDVPRSGSGDTAGGSCHCKTLKATRTSCKELWTTGLLGATRCGTGVSCRAVLFHTAPHCMVLT